METVTTQAFRRRLNLKNTKITTLLDYEDKKWANEILDEFERLHPNDEVKIDWIQKEFGGRLHNWLVATNSKTKKPIEAIIFPENYEEANNIKWCPDFYNFLKGLLSPDDDRTKSFWREESIDLDKINLKNIKYLFSENIIIHAS